MLLKGTVKLNKLCSNCPTHVDNRNFIKQILKFAVQESVVGYKYVNHSLC